LENYVFHYYGKGHIAYKIVYSYDNILLFAEAIFLFLIFLKVKVQSKVINWIASSSFFVYIISENENMYLSPFSMYDMLGVRTWDNSDNYILLILGASLGVFCIAILIDKIRVLMFGWFEKSIGIKLDKINVEFNK